MKTLLSLALIASILSPTRVNANVNFMGTRNDTYTISTLRTQQLAGVDILWVIDDSASMETSQNWVAELATSFLAALTANGIDAKIGLISTSYGEAPFLGFTSEFFSTTPGADATFKNTVQRMGTFGDATEMPFASEVKALTENPTFHRAGVPLVTIFVTDTIDQSAITPADFWTSMQALAPGVQAYYPMVYPIDLGCAPNDFGETQLTYAGSAFEMLVQNSGHGNPISLCQDVAGFNQANIDLVNNLVTSGVVTPTNQLAPGGKVKLDRAVVSSIKVIYNGQEVASGPGGFWKYNAALGEVQFSSFGFAHSDADSITIHYLLQ